MLDFAPATDQGKILINRGELLGCSARSAPPRPTPPGRCSSPRPTHCRTWPCTRTTTSAGSSSSPATCPRALELMPIGRGALGLRTRRGRAGPGPGAAQGRSGQRSRPLAGRRLRRARPDRAGPVPGRGGADPGRGRPAGRAPGARPAPATPRSTGCGRGTTTGPPRWASWSSCEADVAAGVRPDRWSRTADRLTRTFTELGLTDQARLARLIAIEHPEPTQPDARAAADHPARPAAGAAALRPAGPGQAAFARGDRRAGPAAGPDRHARPHRAPGPVRQPGPADLQRGPGVEPRGAGDQRGDRGTADPRPCWPGSSGPGPFPAGCPRCSRRTIR